MNTLKTVVVLAVLAIVGYGLYVGLNNGFQLPTANTETPPWLVDELAGTPGPPNIQFSPGTEAPGNAPFVTSPPAPAPTSTFPTVPFPPPASGTTSGLPAVSSIATPPAPAESVSTPLGAGQPSPGIPDVPNSSSASLDPGQPDPSIAPIAIPDSLAESETVAPPSTRRTDFDAAMDAAKLQLGRGEMSAALLSLSHWYEDARLSVEQRQDLMTLLDQVAGSVIYSREHLLEPAYLIQAGERLADVADRYQVPVGLLAKINGIANPDALPPGTELKVVRGPFNAVINSKTGVMTLWLGGRYAGRFQVATGPEFEGIIGPFVVLNKTRAHSSFEGHPWLQLGAGFHVTSSQVNSNSRLGIAGMSQPDEARQGTVPGRIGIATQDANDLFDILSQGSKVTIQR